MRTILFILIALIRCFALYGNHQSMIIPNTSKFTGKIETIEGPEEELRYFNDFPFQNYQICSIPKLGLFYVDGIYDIIKGVLRAGAAWEPHLVDLMKYYVIAGSEVVDIGAHIGVHTLALSRIVGNQGEVLSFEPQKKLFSELIRNMVLNECTNVTAYRCAIGDTFKEITMNLATPGNEGGTGIGMGGDRSMLVPLDYFTFKQLSFIKIDTENFEDEVLDGAQATIHKHRPYILIEIMGNRDPSIPNRNERIHGTIERLKNLGYSVHHLAIDDWLAIPLEKKLRL